jgi:hypothetical protein
VAKLCAFGRPAFHIESAAVVGLFKGRLPGVRFSHDFNEQFNGQFSAPSAAHCGKFTPRLMKEARARSMSN